MNWFKFRALIATAGCLATVLLPTVASANPVSRRAGGGGFLATPERLRSVAFTVVVPELPCTVASTARSLRIGMFGAMKEMGRTVPLRLGVVASCADGAARYRAGGLRVHPGDVVEFEDQQGSNQRSFSIDDRTTGQGMGGAEGTAGGSLGTAPWVLIGGEVTGKLPAQLFVPFTGVRVDRQVLAAGPHHRRAQLRHENPIVRAGHLNDAGDSFTLRLG